MTTNGKALKTPSEVAQDLTDWVKDVMRKDYGFEADTQVLFGMNAVFAQLILKFARKHNDYGRTNVQRSGEIGLLHRIQDKVSRLSELHFKGDAANFESSQDSIADLAVHGLMLACVRLGHWPNVDARWRIGGP